jgi:hypothetical protein
MKKKPKGLLLLFPLWFALMQHYVKEGMKTRIIHVTVKRNAKSMKINFLLRFLQQEMAVALLLGSNPLRFLRLPSRDVRFHLEVGPED